MTGQNAITLQILTPQQTLFEGLVEKVELPGDKGRFMVLKDHAPIISSLSEGYVVYTTGSEEYKVAVKAGFVRVAGNEIVVCAEV